MTFIFAFAAHLSSQTRPDNVQGEPILIETSEKQLEELVVTLDIGKAHAQLRRLKNEGSSVQVGKIFLMITRSHGPAFIKFYKYKLLSHK